MARKWNAIKYIETSAKTAYHVREIFGCLIREIIAIHYEQQLNAQNQNKNCCQLL